MTETIIRNPEFDYLFEDTKSKFNTSDNPEFMDILKESFSKTGNIKSIPTSGDILEAEYLGLSDDQYVFYVNGLKDDIRVDVKPSETKYLGDIEKGEKFDIAINMVNSDSNFLIKGSVSELYESRAHETLQSMDNDTPVFAEIISLNPTGYEVEVLYNGVSLKAFMPKTLAGVNRLSEPESIVGEKFEVMVESYSEQRGTYVVSRKAYLQSLIPEAVKQLEYGVAYNGIVTGTAPFGVFVQLNECLTGMIYKTNINPDWQDRIHEIDTGFEIDFYIKEVIKEKGKNNYKIILTQILRQTVWDTIEKGQVIEGRIKDIKHFGALVELDDETMGLIHTSEIEKSGMGLSKGQDVDVRVLSFDRSTRKIELSLR